MYNLLKFMEIWFEPNSERLKKQNMFFFSIMLPLSELGLFNSVPLFYHIKYYSPK